MPLFFILMILIFIGVFWDIRVSVRLQLCGGAVYVYTEYRIFYGLIPLHFEFYGEIREPYTWKKLERDRFHIPKITVKKKRKKGAWKSVFSLRRHVRLTRLRCQGEIGCADSAVGTLMFTGLLRIAFDMLAAIWDIPCETALFPSFAGNVCRLKLEGIFVLRAAHIILALLKEKTSRRGEEYAASH
ncbi:MAG: hypothetical protein PHC80_06530 [Eubacteriales bacterium]|nr:hypothetical protein [Eubacteriales bacterium]